MEKYNASTLYCCFAECEDRPHPRVDCRAGVMLAGMRALRKRLLCRNRRPRHTLGSRVPRLGRWVLVGVLRQGRGAPARPSVALWPSTRAVTSPPEEARPVHATAR